MEHCGAHDNLPNEFELPVSLNEQSDGAAIVHGLNNMMAIFSHFTADYYGYFLRNVE
jgi:hypothetical protein